MVTMALGVAVAAPIELCNGIDDNGDGRVDEAPVAWGADDDGDGAGSDTTLVLRSDCTNPGAVWVADISDCDDSDPAVGPGREEICNGIDDDCDGAIDTDACVCEVMQGFGSAVQICGDRAGRDWWNARDECLEDGYDLVTIDSLEFNNALENQTAGYDRSFWIGLTDLENEGWFTWIDGTELDYEDWRNGEPNDYGFGEDCAEIDSRGGWDDNSCSERQAYICEVDAARTWYADTDGDGLGDTDASVEAWPAPASYVANDLDCDDADPRRPAILYTDADGDGFGGNLVGIGCVGDSTVAGDCDDADPAVHPGAPETGGDGIDQDCDGVDGSGSGAGTDPIPPGGILNPPEPAYGFGLGCSPIPHPWWGGWIVVAWFTCRGGRRRCPGRSGGSGTAP